MSPRKGKLRNVSAGYTLVEVMVALSLLAVGITGILSMENAAVYSNQQAQEMTVASNIARRWMELLRSDALQWNSPSRSRSTSDLGTDTQYLCRLVGCAGNPAAADAWVVPSASSGAGTSAAFDYFGNEVPVGNARARYCVNTRLAWLRPDGVARQGLVRAEVRVWWFREGVDHPANYAGCGNAAGLAALGTDITRLHSVHLAAVLGGNPQ